MYAAQSQVKENHILRAYAYTIYFLVCARLLINGNYKYTHTHTYITHMRNFLKCVNWWPVWERFESHSHSRRRTATDVMGKQADTCTTNVLRWWWFRSSQSVGIYIYIKMEKCKKTLDIYYVMMHIKRWKRRIPHASGRQPLCTRKC